MDFFRSTNFTNELLLLSAKLMLLCNLATLLTQSLEVHQGTIDELVTNARSLFTKSTVRYTKPPFPQLALASTSNKTKNAPLPPFLRV